MKRSLQGVIIIVTLAVGIFCAYELMYANSIVLKTGTSTEAKAGVVPPEVITAPPPNPALAVPQPAIGETAPNISTKPRPVQPGETSLIQEAELDNILILVNKQYSLPETYKPGDLVTAEVRFAPQVLSEKKMLRREAAEALARLMEGAAQAEIELYCVSGYRSYTTQKAIYEAKLKAAGPEMTAKYVAFPGQSEHQTGLAMDLTNRAGVHKPLTADFGQTKEGRWLQENAHLYGFVIRYQEGLENITGYSYEPWHVRYVGNQAAESIYTNGQTLEQYLAYSL